MIMASTMTRSLLWLCGYVWLFLLCGCLWLFLLCGCVWLFGFLLVAVAVAVWLSVCVWLCVPQASLQQLVGPVVANIAASVGAGVAVDDASTARVAEELEVLAGVIRFTEVTNRGTAARGSATTTAGGNGGAGGDAEGVHPVVTLMEIAWPLCTQAAAKFGSQPRVASSLCSVFSSVVQAAKWDAAPLLPGMMAQAVAMFTAHRHVCWLEFVGVPAQVCGCVAVVAVAVAVAMWLWLCGCVLRL